MKIIYLVRTIIEMVTKRECGRCKHCLNGVTCDNFQRYYDCSTGVWPSGFEEK